jgi:hypothetical protein
MAWRIVGAGGLASTLRGRFVVGVELGEQVFEYEAEEFGIEGDVLFKWGVFRNGESVAVKDTV